MVVCWLAEMDNNFYIPWAHDHNQCQNAGWANIDITYYVICCLILLLYYYSFHRDR